MQTLNILFVLWVAVTNAYPMSVSERLTNLEHKLDLEHKLVSPTTKTVTEADNLVTEDDEEPESKDVTEVQLVFEREADATRPLVSLRLTWAGSRLVGMCFCVGRGAHVTMSRTYAAARVRAWG